MGTTILEKKSEIARILFSTENDDIVTELFEFTQNLMSEKKRLPCQYTKKEILQRVKESEQQYKEGRVISLEELEKEL